MTPQTIKEQLDIQKAFDDGANYQKEKEKAFIRELLETFKRINSLASSNDIYDITQNEIKKIENYFKLNQNANTI